MYLYLSQVLKEYGNLLPGNNIPVQLPVDGFLNSNAWLSRTISVAGGTTEVQKNIIAQRGLGLPR